MADIKNYLREKEKREQNQKSYKEKIKRHKLLNVYRVVLLIGILLGIAALVYLQYQRHVYTGYDTVTSVPRDKMGAVTDVRLDNVILTYSKDGAHCTDAKGNVTWNQTYEIQDAIVDCCNGVVAIGDCNGRSIYLGNTKQLLGEVSTTLPIRDLAVSETGMVTAVLADEDTTWINTYNAKGENVYSGETHMNNSGYPGAVSLSPNGELLAVSYVYVDAGTLKTNVVFYNFGPVGKNQSDHIVSAQTYHDMLIPMVEFMNDETAFAVGDSRLMFYKGSQKPVMAGEHLFEQEIQSVFYNEDYVGLVFLSENADAEHTLKVYDEAGELVGNYDFNIEYNDILFANNAFVVYNTTECVVMSYDGVEKFNGHFTKNVKLMLPTNSRFKYVLVTDNSIDTIQLK